MTAMAAIPAQFQLGFLLSFLAELPTPSISEMEISPGRTWGSTRRVTKSPIPSTAHPKKSKPGPRLATVAGAKDLTEVNTGSGSVTRVLEGRERLHLKGWDAEMEWLGLWKFDGGNAEEMSLKAD